MYQSAFATPGGKASYLLWYTICVQWEKSWKRWGKMQQLQYQITAKINATTSTLPSEASFPSK